MQLKYIYIEEFRSGEWTSAPQVYLLMAPCQLKYNKDKSEEIVGDTE